PGSSVPVARMPALLLLQIAVEELMRLVGFAEAPADLASVVGRVPVVVVDALHEADQEGHAGVILRIGRRRMGIGRSAELLAQVPARLDEQGVDPLLQHGAILQRNIGREGVVEAIRPDGEERGPGLQGADLSDARHVTELRNAFQSEDDQVEAHGAAGDTNHKDHREQAEKHRTHLQILASSYAKSRNSTVRPDCGERRTQLAAGDRRAVSRSGTGRRSSRQRPLLVERSSQYSFVSHLSSLLPPPPQPKKPHDSATLGLGKSGLKSPAKWRVSSFLMSALLVSVQ